MTTLLPPAAVLGTPADRPLSAMRLLLIDDNPVNLELLEELLSDAGFTELMSLTDAEQTHAVCHSWQPDLVLLDLHMPGRTGFEVLEELREHTSGPDNLPVIVITADNGPEARHLALASGARDFVTKPFDAVELDLRVRTHLATRQLQAQLRRHNEALDRTVADRTRELEQARLESLTVLASVAEYHDDDTHQHTRRVGALAAQLAARIGLCETYVQMIRDAAPLHDIGKIAVPKSILLKPGALTDGERSQMMEHAQIGSDILGRASSPTLVLAEEIARTHHERWDGQGYPAGLAGTEIPVAGRVTAVADVLDALTHARPYKGAWSLELALEEIVNTSGTHFDPRVVTALMELDRACLRRTLGVPIDM